MVECYWPGINEDLIREVLGRAARTPSSDAGRDHVRCLSCILVPSDGMAMFLFEGPSAEVVGKQGSLAEVPFDRIVEAVRIEPLGRSP